MAENLASKYRPKTLDDITEQGLVVDIIRNICSADTISNRNFLFIGPAGCGKAQPLYSKVLTPGGYVNMGDLCVGDEVFTGGGNVGRVSGIFPQGKRPIYQITLQDRTSIRVSDEHLNVVYRYNEDKKAREDYCLTTTELISLFETSRFKLRVDIPAVDWPEQDVPIHPYLLGALIGDGSLSDNFQFSNSEADVVAKLDLLLKDWGKYLRKVPGDNVDYEIASLPETKYPHHIEYKGAAYNTLESFAQALVGEGYPRFDEETLVRMGEGADCLIYRTYPELRGKVRHTLNTEHIRYFKQHVLKSELAKLGLLCKSIDKHIPREYLLNSREVRLELLRGLIDTDGYIDKIGAVTLTTCSDRLSDDIEFLVRSLGIRDTHVAYPAKYRKDGEVIYTGTTVHDHNLKIPNDMDFCSSIKHLSRKVRRQNEPMRNIIAIEYVGEEECQCIMIDHPDHTYISDGFIPTHNTTTARCIANILNEGKGAPIEIDAASHSGAADMREIVNQAVTYPVGMNYKIFIIDEVHSVSQQAWQVALKTLEEQPAKSIFLLCTTNPEKIPATILSRVQTFQLSKISLDGINNRLHYIIDQENAEGRGIKADDDAVLYISKMANGGMRDAITLLDKALAYSNEVSLTTIQQALGLPNYDTYFDLLNALVKKDNGKIIAIVNEVYNSGVNFVKWFENFFAFITNIVKYIYLQDINQTMIPSTYQEKIKGYGSQHAALCLKICNRLAVLNGELRSSQYLQELAIYYLCTPSAKG